MDTEKNKRKGTKLMMGDMAKFDEQIELAMICDANYMIPTMVAIYSLFCNRNVQRSYHISVICSEGELVELKPLCSFNTTGFEVSIIEASRDRIQNLSKSTGKSYAMATENALYKIVLPELLINISKVLYIDGDIIVKKNIDELYLMDVSDCCGVVVKDSGKLYSNRKIVRKKDNYFNTGVMLLNLDKMRGYTEKLIEEKMTQEDCTLMDQDVFNSVIGDMIKTVDNRYNLLYTNLTRSRAKFTMDRLNDFYGYQYKNLRDLYEDACIVHFASKDKPWKNTSSPMSRIWYKYYQEMKKELNPNENYIQEFESKKQKDTALHNCLTGKTNIADRNLIVSFTTYPGRIELLTKMINSLLSQIEIPDKIVVALTKEEFQNGESDLPNEIKDLVALGKLEIIWGERNLKSHNKYFYTMKKYPNDIVITVDDDNVYSEELTWYLYQSYMKCPDSVSTMRAHFIEFENEKIKKYVCWKQELEAPVFQPEMSFLATGVAGCLYPPNSMHTDLFNDELMMKLCPTTDDLWLKIMQIRVGTSVAIAYPNMELGIIKETQKTALYRLNRQGGGNDNNLKSVLDHYSDEKLEEKLFRKFESISEEVYQPIISVVLAVCDNKASIRKCIESLIRQTLKNVEIIIVDNGSKSKILNEFATKHSNIELIINKKYNAAEAANRGMLEAKGKYILFADSNTCYELDYLKKAYYNISKGDADVLIAKVDYHNGDGGLCKKKGWDKEMYLLPKEIVFSFDDIKKDRFNTISYRYDDKLFRREHIIKYSFDTNMNLYGDMMCIEKSILEAERLSYYDCVVGHALYVSDNPHYKKFPWEGVKKSMETFGEYLQCDLGYQKYYNDYRFFILATIFREYDLIDDLGYAEKRYGQIREDIEYFGIDESLNELKSNDDLYKEYLFVMSFDFPREMIKKYIHLDDSRWQNSKESIEIKQKEIEEKNHIIKQLSYDSYCLNEIRKSKSYKIGLFITAVPRKIILMMKKNKG